MVPGYPGVVPGYLGRWGPLVPRLGVPGHQSSVPGTNSIPWYQGVVPAGYLSSVPGYLSLSLAT